MLQGAAQSLREQLCIEDFLSGAELSQDTSPCKLDSEAWIPKLPLQNCHYKNAVAKLLMLAD